MHNRFMPTHLPTPQLQSLADATARVMIVVDQQGIITLLSKLAQQQLNLLAGDSLESELPGFWLQVSKILDGSQISCEIPLQIGDRQVGFVIIILQ